MDEIKDLPSEDGSATERPNGERRPVIALDGAGAFAVEAPARFEEHAGLDLHEYWRILTKRKFLIVAVAVTIAAIGMIRTLTQTPLYTATVRLQIERDVARIVESGNIAPPETFAFDFLKTQYELLQSRSLAERVAAMTDVASDPGFRGPASNAQEDTTAKTQQARRVKAAAHVILANRVVRPVAGSRLVDVSYSDPNPARAQRIATAFGEAFIASTLDKRLQANAYAKSFLEGQIDQFKRRLAESEKALLDFAEKQQIVASADKTSIAESNLAAANATLGNLVAERIKNEQMWKQVRNATEINLPQLLMNPVVEGLRAKRNQLTTEYREKSATFRADYPAMVQISNKIKEIDRQLAAEAQTIRSSLKAAYEGSLSQENEMTQRIERLRAAALDLQKRSIQYNILKREVDSNRSLYEGLLQRFKEVEVAGGAAANNIFIVDRADLPLAPSSPNPLRALTLSLTLGFAIGIAAAYGLERYDDIVHTPEAVERLSGIPTLGVIPKVRKPLDADAELGDPSSAIAEAYRSLCASLQFSTSMGLPRSIFVTSAGPGEGKSISALAMARQFAMTGRKVLIIDADLRNASLHKKFKFKNGMGLSSFLAGVSPRHLIQRTEHANLFFMTSGPLPPNAADLLSGPRLASLISLGLEVFDLIVIDGPPVMGLADAPILANVAEATVVVIGVGQTRGSAIRYALKRLAITRTPILGAIVNRVEASARYGYYYGYDYANDRGASHGRLKKVAEAIDKGVARLKNALG